MIAYNTDIWGDSNMKLHELQASLYDMLCEIDDACKKENVAYFLGGGTLLGAVRHHDFIPWDDDIDLAVWSQNYPAMKQALTKHLPSHLRLTEPHEFAPDFWDFIGRVQDTRYHWHAPTAEDIFYDNKQNYVSVDIFIINHTANTLPGHAVHALKQKILYGLALGHRHTLSSEKFSILQKIEVRLLSSVGKNIPIETLYKWKKHLDHQYDNKPGKYCMITNNIPQYMGLPYERDWFEGTVYLPFRDRLFPVQKGYHNKLTLQYGDYMVPDRRESEYITHADCDDSPLKISENLT